jgi:hypothetical protein
MSQVEKLFFFAGLTNGWKKKITTCSSKGMSFEIGA